MKVLVTGCAGFIGMHSALRLLARGDTVVGIDNLNDYYDPQLKRDRLAQLTQHARFSFQPLDVADRPAIEHLFESAVPDRVVHLAAQAGVRHSIHHPHDYVESNLVGFVNVLECCRQAKVQHLVYASSSSVYGGNTKMPFSEADPVDHPVSLYAATKKANELMAHAYSHLYALPTTGLRFFTVYGPWGRPDMAYFSFTRDILQGRPIRVFNEGRMKRDFTYIDDVVDGIVAALDRVATPDGDFDPDRPDPGRSSKPFRVFNIGHSEPVELLEFIRILEQQLGHRATLVLEPMQPGDVTATYADVSALQAWTGMAPRISLGDGLARFAQWYLGYYPGSR